MEGKHFCRAFHDGDEHGVEKLVESVFGGFLEGKYWKWKYKENPYFDPNLVAVAEENGEVVGCNHWLLRDFKISRSVMDETVLAADIAVRPDHKGKGMGRDLLQFLRLSNVVKKEHVALIYMFADPELAIKFHTPTAGYIVAPDRTVQYTKVLSWKRVRENVDLLNEEIKSGKFRRKLPRNGLRVLFEISAAPPLYIHIKEDGLVANGKGENLEKNVDVVVSGDLSVFNRVKMGKKRKWNFLKALLTGKLKIKVKLVKLFSLFDVLWIFEDIFSKKMT